MALTGAPATLTLTADGQLTIGGETRALADVSELAITGTGGDDILLLDLAIPLTVPVSFDGGDGSDTLVGPTSDVTWAITGPDAGTVAGVAFASVENLTGSPDNQDTFDLAAGGSLSGLIDGGAGGFDSLVVSGTTVVSNPTDAHSGSLILDGNTIRYTGLEPITISAPSVTINGAGGLLGKDLIRISANGLQVHVEDLDPTLNTDITPQPVSEMQDFTISGTTDVTINGGDGVDTVEFTNDYLVPNSNLTVNAETIKVDAGARVCVGGVADPCANAPASNGAIVFNATDKDNGHDFFGITSTILPSDGTIEIVDATVYGKSLDLQAYAGTLRTEMADAESLPNDTNSNEVNVKSTLGFESSGSFVVEGGTGTCAYTDKTDTSFKGVSGCSGSVTAGAAVTWDINQTGNGSGLNHAGVQLIYNATVNVHGASTLTATDGDVTLSSKVDVTATADATGFDKGEWSGTPGTYSKGDVVTYNGTRYEAKNNVTSSTPPDSDTTNWVDATSKDSSVAAAVLVSSAKSQLSGTSTISAANGNVAIVSNMKTRITTIGDSHSTGSGGGIGVGVVVTDSQAFIDSNASTPVTAKSVTISADTDNLTPTTAKAAPGGSKGIDTNANSPTLAKTTVSGAGQDVSGGILNVASTSGFATSGKLSGANVSGTTPANTTVSGAGQDVSAGTLKVASTADFASTGGFTGTGISGTCSYTGAAGNSFTGITGCTGTPSDGTAISGSSQCSYSGTSDTAFTGITGCTGTPADGTSITGTSPQTNAAGGKADNQSKTSDGNQNLSAALAVTVLVATTHAYIAPIDATTVHAINVGTGTVKVHAGAKNAASATADAGNVKFSPDAPILTASGGGSLSAATYYYKITATFSPSGESLPSPEAKVDVSAPGEVSLSWSAVTGATGYKIYRATSTGDEKLLDSVSGTTYTDDGTKVLGSATPPTTDTTSGLGIAVSVNVAVVDTKTWLANNVSLTSGGVTIETTAPSASTFSATSISGAGGSSVGVAGSIAVNIVASDTTADVEGTNPVITLNGADLALTATSKLDNSATADAKQASDGSTTGVGASFALNVVNDTTTAGLPDGSQVLGAKDLTLASTSTDTTTTTANGGASAGTGSFALAAQVAITVSNVTTSASVGTGPDLTLAGALNAAATQTASTTTTANGSTKGGNASIGLSLALAVANHNVDSQLNRNLTAAGAVSFSADGSSTNDTESNASSAGAKADDGSGTGDGTSSKDVNSKADKNLTVGNNASMSSSGKDSGSSATPEAKSGESGGTKVSVAAAAAITIVTVSILAAIAAGLAGVVSVTTVGAVTLTSKGNGDSKVKSSGKAVKGSSANIGAAVSINRFSLKNLAQVGTNVLINAHGLTLSAVMHGTGADGTHALDTEATSGAGKGKFGIAGSLALTIADITTSALVLSSEGRGPPQLNGGNLSLTATSGVDSTAKAMASDKDAGTVGVGAGAAINIVDDITTAAIDDGAAISGAKDVSLTATGSDTMTTYAEAGVDNGSGATLALTADAAIALPTVVTSASIGGDASQTLTATGTISLTATQTAKATTTAKADAVSGKVVIGLALALAIPNDVVLATSSRTLSGTTVSFSATGSSDTVTEADASASGAEGADSGTKKDSSGKDLNGKANDQLSSANGERQDSTGKSPTTSNTDSAKPQTSDDNGTSSGDKNTVTVAGAFAINIVETSSEASLSEVPSGLSLPASPAPGQVYRLDAPTDAHAAGIYSWDGASSSWVAVPAGSSFPSSPTNGDLFQLNSQNGSNTPGIYLYSSGWVRQSFTAPTTTGSGAVSLKTQANTDASAIGSGKADDAGTVGVGAGVAVNKVDIVNLATTGNTIVSSNGLDIEAGMLVNGEDRIQRFDGKKWTAVAAGSSFPEQPTDGQYYQLTSPVPPTTTVSGNQQIDGSHTTLDVKSTAGFGPKGTFKIAGIDGTCTYTAKTGTQFQGVSGCTVHSTDKIDKVTVTATTTTKVHTDQTLPGTLEVASTDDFDTSGKFTVSGVTGTCTYSSKDSTHFGGVTGCSGSPKDGATVTLIAKAPGVYKWNNGSSSWDFQFASGTAFPTTGLSTGTYFLLTATIKGPPAFAPGLYRYDGTNWIAKDSDALPASPTSGDYYQLAEHVMSAQAQAGAGGNKDKFSLAGALALNIVSNETQALVDGGATVNAGTGDVTLTAKTNEAESAKADSDAKSGKVGIGASVGLNVLSQVTRAAIEDGATFSCNSAGCGKLEVSADSRHDVETEDKAGSDGGSLALSPSVSIAIVDDTTTAHVGSGISAAPSTPFEFTGEATIDAAEELDSSVDSNAEAGGSNVAIGAAVAVNVIETTTTSADLDRDLTAASLTVECLDRCHERGEDGGERQGGERQRRHEERRRPVERPGPEQPEHGGQDQRVPAVSAGSNTSIGEH